MLGHMPSTSSSKIAQRRCRNMEYFFDIVINVISGHTLLKDREIISMPCKAGYFKDSFERTLAVNSGLLVCTTCEAEIFQPNEIHTV